MRIGSLFDSDNEESTFYNKKAPELKQVDSILPQPTNQVTVLHSEPQPIALQRQESIV